jgi:sugar (pentulose or hexulose) kinase
MSCTSENAKKEAVFCGLDVGTQGARCVLVAESGRVLGEGHSEFRQAALPGLPDGWFEQDPEDWIDAVRSAVHRALQAMESSSGSRRCVCALSVTSTSGTLCAVDAAGLPVVPAIMYNDSRSRAEADAVQQSGRRVAAALGYKFASSFGLPKIVWLKKNRPEAFERARWFLSPVDFIIGRLTGEWGWTDQTNALKFGYDLLMEEWPAFIERDLGVPADKMPRVQMCGERAGILRADVAASLGLQQGTPVAAGLTDGCASQISCGAVLPGDFNTTIGTTLVVKGVTERIILDPLGRVYCHLHPEGWWLPGGASNTGAECIAVEFSDAEVEALSAEALEHSPTNVVAYPLVGHGERFPFVCDSAERFVVGRPRNRAEQFVSYLEGVACLERMSFEVLEELGARVGEVIYSAGGGSRNDAWLQIRADVLGRAIARPAVTGAAMGVAIVAAMMDGGGKLSDVARRMVRLEREVTPRSDMLPAYEAKYQIFKTECQRRGYAKA